MIRYGKRRVPTIGTVGHEDDWTKRRGTRETYIVMDRNFIITLQKDFW